MGARSEGRAWYEEAFRADYVALYPHRDLAAARSEAEGLVARGLRGRVLDLACGFGRHVAALRELGVDAFGIDLSAELLALARRGETAELLRGRLARGDARRLPVAGGTLEGVAMLFSSFGYLGPEEDALVLREIARVLRPEGTCVLDLMNPGRVRATLVPESRTERGGAVLRERRRLEDGGRRVVKEVRLVRADGGERSWREDVRLYETGELRDLAAPAGLALERVEGGFDGRPAGPDAPRRIHWLRRARLR